MRACAPVKLRFFNNQLAFRLVLISLLIGSVLSVVTTAIQLFVSYDRQRGDATAVLDQIGSALVQPLEFALWTFDFNQINIILDGIATNESVAHLHLTSETGQSWERGTQVETPLVRSFDLSMRTAGGDTQRLGILRVEISLQAVNQRIWEQLWVTLATNLAKAYVAAIVLLYAVHRLITRHLRNISVHVRETDIHDETASLRLDRTSPVRPDDLDLIVAAIRNFEQRASTSVAQLKQEVADRIKSEQAAHEALSVRSAFISTMSHEVRTPLNSIMGLLHLIELEKTVPDKQRNYAHVATKAAQQLLNQLSNVLEMSRLQSNAVVIATRPTDIRRLASQWQATAEATVHFRDKPIKVTLDLDDALDDAYLLDGARVTQIVTNLTDNAAKFTKHGEIRIGLRTVPQTRSGHATHGLEISVADTGEGIDESQRQCIFERFIQSDATIQRAHGGSGLGLAISREVATLMGAELKVCAEKKDGFSTCFLITLGCNVRVDNRDD